MRLTITSEDVIHSFYVPAFRVKQDAVPGRYTTAWFQATKPGQVPPVLRRVLRHPALRDDRLGVRDGAGGLPGWLAGRTGRRVARGGRGQKLFRAACVTCHRADSAGPRARAGGPLRRTVQLAERRQTVVADEAYMRESILTPAAKVVAGYQPIMPTYQGLVSEEDLLQLIAYIKSLPPAPAAGRTLARPPREDGNRRP